MKRISILFTLAAFILSTPAACYALWEIAPVGKAEAAKLGMEVRSIAAGPKAVRVELEFKLEGELKGYSRVDLRIGQGDAGITAPLREERPKEGHVMVSFSADRDQLDQIRLWVMIPGSRGGVVYEVRVSDFVEAKK